MASSLNSRVTPTKSDRRMLVLHHIAWEDAIAGSPLWLLEQVDKLTRDAGEQVWIQARLRQERDAWRWRCKLMFALLLLMLAIVVVRLAAGL